MKQTRPRSWTLWCCLFCSALVLSDPAAFATLGKAERAIPEDQKSLKLEKSEAGTAHAFRFVKISSPDLIVKEYVNPRTGMIFGVSWKGSRPPDLLVVLGFDPATLKGPGVYRSLRFSRFDTPTLYVEFGGIGGPNTGRAVRKDLLPSGVSQKEVALP